MKLHNTPIFLFGTLRGRLILSVAVVHAIMMTLFVIDLTVRQRIMLLDRQEETAIALSQSLSTSAAGWLEAKDISGLQEIVETQWHYPELAFAILADEKGQILAHTDKTKRGQFLLDLPGKAGQTVITKTQELVDIAVPAFLEGKHVGWARVGLKQNMANNKLVQIAFNGALYALAAIIIGSFIAWYMGRRITKRLYAVQDTIYEVKSGNPAARSTITGTDEAASIAHEFNTMLDVLNDQASVLAESEIKYRTLIQKIQAAVVVHGSHTQIVISNSLAQELLGLTEEQMLGKTGVDSVWHFLHEDGSKMPPEEYPVNKVFSTHQTLRNYVVGVHRLNNQNDVWVLVNADPVLSGMDEIIQIIVTFIDITEQKEAEKKLKQASEEIRDLYNHAPCGYHSLDKNGMYVNVNDTELEWLGYPREDVLEKMKFAELLTLESSKAFKENFRYFKESGVVHDLEYEMIRKDGSILPILLSATTITDSHGNFLMSRATVNDITERRRAEEAYYERQRMFRTLVENSPDIIARYDRDCKRIYINPAYMKTAQIPAQKLIETSPIQLSPLPAESAVILQNLLRKVLDTGVAEAVDVIWPKADNIDYWYNIYATPEFDRDGKVISIMTISRDITNRKRDEALMKRLNRELKAISNCNQTLLRAMDEQTLLDEICRIICNEAGYQTTWVGYVENDVFMTICPVAWSGIESKQFENIKFSLSGKNEYREEPIGIVVKSGEMIYSQDFAADSRGYKWDKCPHQNNCRSGIILPLKDENAAVFGVLLIFTLEVNRFTQDEIRLLEELSGDLAFGITTLRDSKKRKQIEEALRSSEEKLRTIFDTMEEALSFNELIRNELGEVVDYKILEVNPAFEKETGLLYENVVYKKATEIDGLTSEYFNNFWKSHKHDVSEIRTDFFVEKSDTWKHISASAPVDDKFVISFFDITERKRAEKEIIIAKEKAEEMNRVKTNFFLNMSHELRTPFVGIIGYAELLKEIIKEPDVIEIVNGILLGSKRLVDTLTKILDFTKIEYEETTLFYSDINIEEVIDTVLKKYSEEAKKCNLYMKKTIHGKPVYLHSDQHLISEIVDCLVNNAVKYTNEGGVEIEAIKAISDEKEYIILKVEDTGIGIPKEKQEIIWEEFRQVSEGSTRNYQGIGLGLSIVRKYAEKLGGRIYVESEEGKGSSFFLELPV